MFYLSGQISEIKESSSKSKKSDQMLMVNVEDAVTKIIKLLANLSTEEQYAPSQLQNVTM